MAPSQSNKGLKKSRSIVKSFWEKLKTPKYDLVLDAVPDDNREKTSAEDSGQHPEEKPKNMFNEKTSSKNEQTSCESDEETIKDEDFSETREEKRQEKTNRRHNKKSKDSPTQTTYNIHDISGSVQIGPVNTRIINIQQNFKAGVPKKEKKVKKNVQLTPEIKDVLKSPIKLETNHVAFMSKHFGKSVREIGLVLGLSSGQLDEIETDCGKDTKEMSFEILSSWMRNNGDRATIGNLCMELWNSEITRAREAVKQLSKNMNDFD